MVFNNNFFYENWNQIYENELIEFILPLEKIEILQIINNYKNNLINLNLIDLFPEYKNKNLALILIGSNKTFGEKVYLKTIIQGKKISKNLIFKNEQEGEKRLI